jgi:hypothetical protein
MSKRTKQVVDGILTMIAVTIILGCFGIALAQRQQGEELKVHRRDIDANAVDIQTVRQQGDVRWDSLNEKVNRIDRGVSRIEGILEKR